MNSLFQNFQLSFKLKTIEEIMQEVDRLRNNIIERNKIIEEVRKKIERIPYPGSFGYNMFGEYSHEEVEHKKREEYNEKVSEVSAPIRGFSAQNEYDNAFARGLLWVIGFDFELDELNRKNEQQFLMVNK